MQSEKGRKKLDERFDEIAGEVKVGDTVKMKQNRQVGLVKGNSWGRKALLQSGDHAFMTVALADLVVVKQKEKDHGE